MVMQITIAVSTDEGNLLLKHSFAVTSDKRDKCIQAAATLLNVSMCVMEEIERKEVHSEERTCATCLFSKDGRGPCDDWKQKEC
jgi:hypothetical protein